LVLVTEVQEVKEKFYDAALKTCILSSTKRTLHAKKGFWSENVKTVFYSLSLIILYTQKIVWFETFFKV